MNKRERDVLNVKYMVNLSEVVNVTCVNVKCEHGVWTKHD